MKLDIQKQNEQFDSFFRELVPVLVEFFRDLKIGSPIDVVNQPESLLASLSDYLSNQVITDADKSWLTVRLCYYLGEIINHRYGGCWFVNESLTSHVSGHFVVGRFSKLSNPTLLVSPAELATDFLDRCENKTLDQFVAETFAEITSADKT